VELDSANGSLPAVGPDVPLISRTEQSQRHVKPDVHRDFMSCFPTGIAVVTTVASDGTPWGLTCSSLSSVSLRPPVLSVCMGVWSRTLAATRDHGSFAVNLLSVHGLAAAEIFASAAPGHFNRVRWWKADTADLPRLEDTAAFAACRVIATYRVGDHVVVFGEVTAVDCGEDIPLLYGLRHFAAWPGDGFRPRAADPSVTRLDRKGS
jgi:flavin reductase (NADH)